jgi:hypothetical protein
MFPAENDWRDTMAKVRSPQYPVIGLGEAIGKAKAIYGEEYQSPISKVVVAKHMGFSSLNGKSLGMIAALTRYGLLEGRGNDCRISDRAVTIIAHPAGSPERIEAIRQAAASPSIFLDLDKRSPDGKGSDEGLRAYLMTNKFIPDAAATAIRSYRETQRVVAVESKGYDSTVEAEAPAGVEAKAPTGVAKTIRTSPPPPPPPPSPFRPPPPNTGLVLMEGERELTTGLLSKGTSFRLIVSGSVGVKEINMLIKKLELDKEILADEDRSAKEEETDENWTAA